MKKIFLTVIVAIMCFLPGYYAYVNNKYVNEIEGYWHLADKSSTIAEKEVHIANFVDVLASQSNLRGKHSVLIFQNIDNSFDYNLMALRSLRNWLFEIKSMDVKSFEYNTAIQQITAQEQGEAIGMLNVFKDTYFIENYIYLYIPILSIIEGILCIIGLILLYRILE